MVPMPKQTVVALFERRGKAREAIEALVAAGIDRGAIRTLPEAGCRAFKRTSEAAYDHDRDEGGFWASLDRLSLPEEDRYAYAEGMSRGGVIVAVTADEAEFERVPDIFERAGAVDIDECEGSRRREGWAGCAPPSARGASEHVTRTSGNSAAYAAFGAGEPEGARDSADRSKPSR